MKTFLSFKFTAAFLLSLGLFVQAWTLNIIDIEETTFSRGVIHISKDGTKIKSPTQLKLIDFDITNQKFEKILYIITPKEACLAPPAPLHQRHQRTDLSRKCVIHKKIYKDGKWYKKAGIYVCDMTDRVKQTNLFESIPSPPPSNLMRAMDTLNQRYGNSSVKFGA